MLASELITLLTWASEALGNGEVTVSESETTTGHDIKIPGGGYINIGEVKTPAEPAPEPSEKTEVPTEIAQKSEIRTQETAVEDHDSGDEQPTQPTA